MILPFKDEQVWLSRAEGGVPDAATCSQTYVSVAAEGEGIK